MLHVALQEQLRLLEVGRRRQCGDAEHARTDLFRDRLDRAALAGGIPPLEQDDDPELVGPDPFLQVAKLDLQLSQLLLVDLALHPRCVCVGRHARPFAASN
jgi:hypothetical protein